MFRFLTCVLALIISFLFPTPSTTLASEEEAKVLVVYSTENRVIDENQRQLDLLIGHFTSTVEFVSIDRFQTDQFEGVTHLFYQGLVPEQLPEDFTQAVQSFEGTIVAFGYNAEQLRLDHSFSGLLEEKRYNQLFIAGKEDQVVGTSLHSLMTTASKGEVLIWAKGGDKKYPIMTKYGNHYYVGSSFLHTSLSTLLGEVFHDVFQDPHIHENPGYIRIEDIHPLVDPVRLKRVADELKNRNLPYMVAVIPVYMNPKTGKTAHLSDYPEVLEVVKYMQKHGGSIVLHGYTHQYHTTETGEGFEFWDVKNNSPIYKPANDFTPIKSREQFPSDKRYESYINSLQSFEQKYIEEKVKKGVHELLGYGLHPLAFEAPHYTMSQNGYKTLADHFSLYVGQVQLSDENWEAMDGAPYITRPTFLEGMTLLPETLGYVKPSDPSAISNIVKKAKEQFIVRDGMVSVFYHPYLGIEPFKKLLDELEKLKNIQWIDLKEQHPYVTIDEQTIEVENGNVMVSPNPLTSILDSKRSYTYFLEQSAKKISWTMVGISGVAVAIFGLYTYLSYKRLKKSEGDDKIG